MSAAVAVVGASCVGERSTCCCCACLAVFRADSTSPPFGRPRLKALHMTASWAGERCRNWNKNNRAKVAQLLVHMI